MTAGENRSRNRIQEVLDDAELPWHASRRELAARYGIRRHAAYDWDVIEVAGSPAIIPGLLWPLSARVLPQFPPHLPATLFTGVVHVADDAGENFRFAVGHFTRRLGPGGTSSCANSIETCWSDGAARLRLVFWPPAMQQCTFTNPARERDPRLETGCLLSIDTGFRPATTATERGWLATFRPVAAIEVGGMSELMARQSPAAEGELEYVRDPPVEAAPLFGAVGFSADRKALVFYGAQLYVMPVEAVVGFQVARFLPAKGAGGSRLEVECGTLCAGLQSKRLLITKSTGTEDLNALAAKLAREAGRPFVLGEPQYDA